MIRKLLFSALLAFGFSMPVPSLAQKAALAPEVESLVKAQSPESVKASLRQDAGARRSAPATPAKAAPAESSDRNDLRMLVVALLLMVAIAIRRYRSDAR